MRYPMQRVMRHNCGLRVQTCHHAQTRSARAAINCRSSSALTLPWWGRGAPRRVLLRIRLLVAAVIGGHGSGRGRVRTARLIPVPAGGFGGPWARDRVAVVGHTCRGGSVSVAALSCAARLRKRYARHTERSRRDACRNDGQNCLVHIGSPLVRRAIAPRHRHIRDLRGSGCTSRRDGPRACTASGTVTPGYQSRMPVSPVNENRP